MGGSLIMTLTVPRRRYRIILRGDCARLLATLLDDAAIESSRGWTCVLASVRDDSELYGLLDRFEELALHIVSLNELGADVLRPRAVPGGRP
jgi:hypothetical protein